MYHKLPFFGKQKIFCRMTPQLDRLPITMTLLYIHLYRYRNHDHGFYEMIVKMKSNAHTMCVSQCVASPIRILYYYYYSNVFVVFCSLFSVLSQFLSVRLRELLYIFAFSGSMYVRKSIIRYFYYSVFSMREFFQLLLLLRSFFFFGFLLLLRFVSPLSHI